MKPVPATSEVLEVLAALGDERLGTQLGWIAELVLEAVPQADAMSVWFADEELTLVMHAEQSEVPADAVRDSIRSSLAVTIADGPRTVAVITTYSGSVRAFAGRIRAVERTLGAVPNAWVLDGDVEFRSWYLAESAPSQVRGRLVIDTAVGLIMGQRGLDVIDAEDWLRDTCESSGLPLVELATRLVSNDPDLR